MPTSTTSAFPLATEQPYTGGQDGTTGDANSGAGSPDSGDAAGASGTNTGGAQISRGAMIAIIVVVVVVCIIGSEFPQYDSVPHEAQLTSPAVASSVLFYVAKKREWKVRETIRKSARKVVTALTPRRSEFPRSVKDGNGRRSRNGRVRLDDVPPTPRLKPEDLEKGFEFGPIPNKSKRSNFSRK
jgi:hypothetical protein